MSDRQKRLRDLDRSFREKHDPFKLRPGETKLGEGANNIVVGPDYVSTNQESIENPGFTFQSSGSEVRPGKYLNIKVGYQKVYFARGEEGFNLLATEGSAVTKPLPTIVSNFPQEYRWPLSPLVGAALASIRAISLI